MTIELNDHEVELIQRMREFKLSRRSRLQHIREIIESPAVKPALYERIYAEDRAKLSMFARMV